MKKKLFSYALILLCLISCKRTKIVYYDDEKTLPLYKNEVNWKKQLDGLSIEYFNDGMVRSEIMFKNNMYNGEYIQNYREGNLHFKIQYIENRLWNVIEYYDENRNKLDFGNLKNGYGTIKKYSPEGNLRTTGSYSNGLRDGKWDFYSNAGYGYSKIYKDGKIDGIGEVDYSPPF